MRPIRHALSSARTEREWIDDLSIHEFLDSSKYGCADRRHRVVLHHVDLGAYVASLVFPDRPDAQDIARRHVAEDLGHPATLRDWFDHARDDLLPRPVERRLHDGWQGVARLVGAKLPPEQQTEVDSVTRFLFLPAQYLDVDPVRALPTFMNATGPMIVRQVFGPPRPMSHGAIVDYSWIAEAVIFTCFGRIPDLRELVDCFPVEPTAEHGREVANAG